MSRVCVSELESAIASVDRAVGLGQEVEERQLSLECIGCWVA